MRCWCGVVHRSGSAIGRDHATRGAGVVPASKVPVPTMSGDDPSLMEGMGSSTPRRMAQALRDVDPDQECQFGNCAELQNVLVSRYDLVPMTVMSRPPGSKETEPVHAVCAMPDGTLVDSMGVWADPDELVQQWGADELVPTRDLSEETYGWNESDDEVVQEVAAVLEGWIADRLP